MHESFLQSIIAAPDDDAPRLVYADWLEENGEPERATFIRVQCELAHGAKCQFDDGHALPCEDFNKKFTEAGWLCKNCQRYEALRRRERELLAKNEIEWTESTFSDYVVGFDANTNQVCILVKRAEVERGVVRTHFCRGFVSAITCAWADWLAHYATVRAATPLREVTLTTYPFQQANVVPGRSRDELELDILHRRWPGITFHLPPANENYPDGVMREATRREHESIMRASARPR